MLCCVAHLLSQRRAALRCAARSEVMRGLLKKRCHLRNKYQAQIKAWRAECGIKGDGDHLPTAELVRAVVVAGLFGLAMSVGE